MVNVKPIKLSPKRGGNGYISSYTVNLGVKEAEMCGLLGTGKQIIKIIDPYKKQIIIKECQ